MGNINRQNPQICLTGGDLQTQSDYVLILGRAIQMMMTIHPVVATEQTEAYNDSILAYRGGKT